jgi:hypothetical protein
MSEGAVATAAPAGPVVQCLATNEHVEAHAPTTIAAQGTHGAGEPLPYLDRIQASLDGMTLPACARTKAATRRRRPPGSGRRRSPSTTRSDSRRHRICTRRRTRPRIVVQQRGGVQLRGGVGQPGDEYERHADEVADAVVAGR